MPARHTTRLAAAALTSLALAATGCASKKKEDILPQDGPTMKEVYDGHFRRQGFPAASADAAGGARPPARAADGADPGGRASAAAAEANARFPRLPNPDLEIYIFPHLSGKGYPVPGYTTVVPMYETVEYALPGEAEGWSE